MGALRVLSPATCIMVLAVVAIAALAYLFWAFKAAKLRGAASTTASGPFSGLLSNPLIQRLASHAAATAQATHHAALDAGIVTLFPAAAPFIPAVNAVVDRVEAKIAGAPAPLAVDIPQLLSQLEALVQHLKATAPEATNAGPKTEA